MRKRTMKPGAKIFFTLLIVGVIVGGIYWAYTSTNIFDAIAPQEGTASSGSREQSRAAARVAKETGVEPVNICVVTWGGYAGGQYYNGGFEPSTSSRFYTEHGILVRFLVMDDFEASRSAWQNGECNGLWVTADAFPTETASLLNAGFEPVFLFQADWSRGGDVIVTVRGINSMSDLRGKSVAVALGTPSHTFLLQMLAANNMRPNDITIVKTPTAIEAAQAFQNREVDAAVVWSPDDVASLEAVPGSTRLIDTKTARYIIADGFYFKEEYVRANRETLLALIEGWMIGAAEINESESARRRAAEILAEGLNVPVDFANDAIGNVRLTTIGDNMLFFGHERQPGFMTGSKLFSSSGRLYQDFGYTDLVPSVPSFRQVSDGSLVLEVARRLTGPKHSAEGRMRFTEATTAEREAPEFASKPLSVNFATGSSQLDANAMTILDTYYTTLESFEGARVRVQGNTDSTGSRSVNIRLSRERAEAVVDYFVDTYGYQRTRFVVEGNGPDNPVCTSNTSECYARNRRTDFQLIK